jgi:hypothetical protein
MRGVGTEVSCRPNVEVWCKLVAAAQAEGLVDWLWQFGAYYGFIVLEQDYNQKTIRCIFIAR